MKQCIHIHPDDTVVILLIDAQKGTQIPFENGLITLQEDIKSGHKVAVRAIQVGENIIKYGESIGQAKESIALGSWVHTHNIQTNLSDIDYYTYTPLLPDKQHFDWPEPKVLVYHRADGQVGIRNELWIIPTVGCVNQVAQQIKEQFLKQLAGDLGVDNITILSHPYGCSQLGEDHHNTRTILQNSVKHPNAGGVLVVGLGCENNQITEFKATLGTYNEERVRFLVAQEVEDEVSVGVELLKEIYDIMQVDRRESAPLSVINFGLECGGSDGLSGITANPMLGLFSDYISHIGGTTVLTEVPEMFGAEQLLMQRCINEEVFLECVSMINAFKAYFLHHDQVIYENPSPGNKVGGISTLEDKSLGCTQKSGSAMVVDVLAYGQRLKRRGLTLLSAPGNDLVATTALIASGCHLVLFSTGRGTPYGGVAPTVKIATNSVLYHKKNKWMDFNAGVLIEQSITIEELTIQFVDYLVEVINGKRTCNEKSDNRDLAIFKSGVTL